MSGDPTIMKFRLFILLLVTCSLLFHSPPDFEAFAATNSDGTVKSGEVEIDDDDVTIIDNNDRFGWSVENIGDLDGDGVNDLAVGAPRSEEPNSADNISGCCVGSKPYHNRGAVHILFMNADGSVKSTAEIIDPTTNGPKLRNGDLFGYSLQSVSDLNADGIDDLVVGAFSDNGSGEATPLHYGNIHILFLDTDGSLVRSTVEVRDDTTNGPDLANSDGFGVSIANIGDFDGNGFDDLAVGARNDDAGGSNRGAVHILFLDTNGSLASSTVEVRDDTTNGPSLAAGDGFGSSVANIGDFDGNGFDDLAVGAKNDDAGGANSGAVHILFMNTGGSLASSTVEINSSTENGPTLTNNDKFGTSIVNIGDLDGDGVNDLAVGAPNDDMDENGNASGANDRGAVHIMFMNTNGSVKSTVEINDSTTKGPTLADADRFGFAITNIGDFDDNGITDLAIGAYQGGIGTNRGAVHIVFMQETDKPTVTITSSNGDCGDNLDSLTTLRYTATFNESTSNFVVGDITVTGTANYGSVETSNFAGSGTTYTFDVVITSVGTALVSIASGVATDAAGNDNTASNSCTFTIYTPATSSTCARHVILGNCGTIAINSDVYRIIDPLTNVPTTEVLVGQPVTVTLSTPDEPTHTKIHFASVHTEVFSLPLNHEQSAHIDYSIVGDTYSVSKAKLFQIASATHRISQDTNVKNLKLFEVVFTMVFAKPMNTSHVVIETKNALGIPETLYLMSALKVNENPAQALTLEEKSKFSIIDPDLSMKRLGFVDPEKDPSHYVKRYITEPKYKAWFDKNYPAYTIYEAIGITFAEYQAIESKIVDPEPEMDPEPEPTKKEKKSKKKRR